MNNLNNFKHRKNCLNFLVFFLTGLIIAMLCFYCSKEKDSSEINALCTVNESFFGYPGKEFKSFSGGINITLSSPAKTFYVKQNYKFRLDIEMTKISDLKGQPQSIIGASKLYLLEDQESYSMRKFSVSVAGRTISEAVADVIGTIGSFGSIERFIMHGLEVLQGIFLNYFGDVNTNNNVDEYDIKFSLPDDLDDPDRANIREISFSQHGVAYFDKALVEFEVEFDKSGEHSLVFLPCIAALYLSPGEKDRITGSTAGFEKPLFYNKPIICVLQVQEDSSDDTSLSDRPDCAEDHTQFSKPHGWEAWKSRVINYINQENKKRGIDGKISDILLTKYHLIVAVDGYHGDASVYFLMDGNRIHNSFGEKWRLKQDLCVKRGNEVLLTTHSLF